ncbi:MAG: MBL fold metallo-hydrolase [Pseudomonadota bacterium]
MSSAVGFKLEFEPRHGEAVDIAPNIQRITACNESPFTFRGTNSYLLGGKSVAVIDPGPEDEAHFQALLRGINGRPVSHIIITHTHRDHSPLAARLQEVTGAQTYAEGPHRAARPLELGEINPLDASSDTDFEPDVVLADGQMIEGEGWALQAIHTPGHTANHTAFALTDSDYLFSGDHVMAWATSIVAPPDGAMSDYMASLEVLLDREESIYFPGHGGRLENARAFVRALKAHRKMREKAVLERVRENDRSIQAMVKVIYRDTDPRLHQAAALSVLAHMEDLVARGAVSSNGPAALDGEYWID